MPPAVRRTIVRALTGSLVSSSQASVEMPAAAWDDDPSPDDMDSNPNKQSNWLSSARMRWGSRYSRPQSAVGTPSSSSAVGIVAASSSSLCDGGLLAARVVSRTSWWPIALEVGFGSRMAW